jgi:hypothetical protein
LEILNGIGMVAVAFALMFAAAGFILLVNTGIHRFFK